MPKFELVSLEEALEATKNDRWLAEEFGEEIELAQCPECDGTNLTEDATKCFDCYASDYQ